METVLGKPAGVDVVILRGRLSTVIGFVLVTV